MGTACRQCGEPCPPDAWFCPACGVMLSKRAEVTETRKRVTVVFCDVADSTTLGESLDPESLRAVMTRYFEAMSAVLTAHGGTVEKFIGDAVVAVFGVPRVREDDALRAIHAAAAMRERLAVLNDELEREHGIRLQIRTGVNTGEVVAGDPVAGQGLVIGDAVNVAARLEQQAASGEIMIGAETHGLVRDAVEVEALGPLALKGKSDRVAALRLLGVEQGQPAYNRRFDAPFVARKAELEALHAELDTSILQRVCRLVTVLGPAGIGKSRLVQELVSSRHARALSGRCLPYGEGITYWPLVEIVRQAVGEDARAVAALVEHDGDLIAKRIAAVVGQGGEAGTPEEMFWAVRRLLETIARTQPLVVVLDDMEWAAPTFLDLVESLAAFVTDTPLLILVAARPELLQHRPSWTSPRRNAELLVLDPLSDTESTLLIHALRPEDDLAESERERVLSAAEGNPLFVEQMLAMRADTQDGAQVPATIQALLAARVDALPDGERAVIQRASIEGRVFHRGALSVLLPRELQLQVTSHLLELARKDFIGPFRSEFDGDDAYRFRHILIRDAAYAALPKHTRGDLHERFARWLEGRAAGRDLEYEEILAHHLEQAYRCRAEISAQDPHIAQLAQEAGGRLAAAGLRAHSRMDMTAAVNLLTRALALLPTFDPRRGELGFALSDARIESGDFAQGIPLLREVVDDAVRRGDPTLAWRARAELTRANHMTLATVTHEALDLALAAVAVLEPLGDDAGLARAWRLVATVYNTIGRTELVRSAAARLLEHARRLGDARLEAEGCTWIGLMAFSGDDDAAEAQRTCEMLVATAQTPLLRAQAHFWLTAVRAYGDHALVRTELDGARQACRDLGLQSLWARTAITCGKVHLYWDEPAVAERILSESAAALAAAGEMGIRSTVLGFLAHAQHAQGRHDDARGTAQQSADITIPDDRMSLTLVESLRSKLAVVDGDYALAEVHARRALAPLDGTGFAYFQADAWAVLTDALRRLGRLDEARDAAGRALALYGKRGITPAVEATRRVLAELRPVPTS